MAATDTIERDSALDPVTYEVVRNRLWSINDQQALMTGRISGSPTIYEANDFNSAIMDRDGACLFLGVYVTFFGTSLTQVVGEVKARFGDDINEGDMFITNDPWVGALHQMDMAVVAPVFHEGELIAWTGITMHEEDVGGPVPGSWALKATEVFGESTLYPLLRLRDGGVWRHEIEALLLRNTRTAPLNTLNIRARVAGQTIAHERILDIVERYGKETFLAVLAQVKDHGAKALRTRLAALPDGEWSERMYVDHDSNDDISYPIVLTMTKKGEHLRFDFTGTAKQANGLINCARSGLEGGIMAAVLPLLCYDVPWTSGSFGDIIEIVSEEGTINNALYPAPVSMAPIAAAWITTDVANSCIAKMLGSAEEFRDEVQASWVCGWHGIVLAGLDQRGHQMAGILMDAGSGGSGARIGRDGIDAGGLLTIISNALTNVETNERHYPILQLYRRHGPDSAGAGAFRGGVGCEMAFTPHKNPVPVQMMIYSQGGDYPAAPGIFGGQPGCLQRSIVARGTDFWEQTGAGRMPGDLADLSGEAEQNLETKDGTVIDRGDVIHSIFGGGGGFGDPLDRDPGWVQRDVERGLLTKEVAGSTYGAVFDAGGAVDIEATAGNREAVRKARLSRAQPVGDWIAFGQGTGRPLRAASGTRLGNAFEVDEVGELACQRCDQNFGNPTEDPRRRAVMEKRAIDDLSPINRYGNVDEFDVYAYYCPGCGTQVGCEVQLKEEGPQPGDVLA